MAARTNSSWAARESCAVRALFQRYAMSGNLIRKTAPFWFSSAIWPLCAVTIVRAIERPIIVRGRRPHQRASDQNVVPGKGHEHRVLDIVVQRVAVADAIERKPGGVGQEVAQIRV